MPCGPLNGKGSLRESASMDDSPYVPRRVTSEEPPHVLCHIEANPQFELQ